MKRKSWIPLLLIITACPAPAAIWLQGTPTPNEIVFGLGTKRGGGYPFSLGTFIFTTCGEFQQDINKLGAVSPRRLDHVIWYASIHYPANVAAEVEAARDSAGEFTRLRQISLGQAPPGFSAPKEMRWPLAPGCYVAEAYGTGTAMIGVVVGEDGTVRSFDTSQEQWPDSGR